MISLKIIEGEDLEEFKGLEGGETIDQDFGDLENLNLEDIDLDIDIEEEAPATSGDVHQVKGNNGYFTVLPIR